MITICVKLTIEQKRIMAEYIRLSLTNYKYVASPQEAFVIDSSYSTLEKLLQRQLSASKIRFNLFEIMAVEMALDYYSQVGDYEAACAFTLRERIGKQFQNVCATINHQLSTLN